ncbi:exodeoxyribonuclease IX [Arenicella chitinivorans]|uniref:Exodeoxyribonuclease IX n=1 Tax=Arenicella chitinivorans TaxID=1329800 RepID=A0A918RX95_9GAMM|nr:5'-3' exonuclease H3TH domain-containing protein [Arenicella chitinivorans]GHA12188.1 exodeoxyribonuclease IX [Arenicella chitinivorans]
MQATSRRTVYLIDASIYIFRAWFSVPDSMRGENGMPVNALYGFCRFLTEFAEKSNASHVGIAFDESLTQSFRNELYPAYKMNRELPPEDLKKQFKYCKRLAEAAGFHCVGHDRYEADDIIATWSANMRRAGFRNAIVSGDKDLAQLLQGEDFWWDFARNVQLDSYGVTQKFGVPPECIQDYLGLCGDAVDNIPGVPGVGPKTASVLLSEFGSMERMYDNLDAITQLPIRGAKSLPEKLATHKEVAMLSKLLATVAYDAPIDASPDLLQRRSAEVSSLQEIGHIMGGRGDGLFARLAEASNRVA